MEKQAYGYWKTMLCETLVRACGVRYLLARNNEKMATDLQTGEEIRGFYWVRGVSNLLCEYEANRNKYPNLDSFFPRIIDYMNRSVDQLIADIRTKKEQEDQKLQRIAAKSPKIISMVPSDGAQDVDPSLQEVRVTFDRRMRDSAFSVMGGSDYHGEPLDVTWIGYDSTKTVLIMKVTLKPGTLYRFGLNHIESLYFQSAQHDPLIPTICEFRTRSK